MIVGHFLYSMKHLFTLLALILSFSAVDAQTAGYESRRPAPQERLFVSPAVEAKIDEVTALLTNDRLRLMFANCFPNTLDTTVHPAGEYDTFVYTGDIAAMWLRDSGAQVWPYLSLVNEDEALRKMIAGVIVRQFRCICLDPYANAFYKEPDKEGYWKSDYTDMKPGIHERKWEIDSHCYPIRLAYEYWKITGDDSVFSEIWLESIQLTLQTFREQQRKNGVGPYTFMRQTHAAYDTLPNYGKGTPVNPVGLIVSSFRPSDDATTFQFLVPSNFFAVTSLRKAAEILETVNGRKDLADQCIELAAEVEEALKKYATYDHPEFGTIYAYEVDGFGNRMLMDDANVPSLLAMPYLGDVDLNDPIYQNTRRFVWSGSNPYFFRGTAGEGIGGPHVGYDMAWPMSIMMKAFTSQDDAEIKWCIELLMTTDAGTGFMHESFDVNDPQHFTREWFAWQNGLFGELILKIIADGRLELLNSINI
ncbi:MAG: glycoside hydrolase family 125 protein [Bacteroidales bacterium]|nr:glycoside hydrolase family 125 protein [Bacteroidales bacterium]